MEAATARRQPDQLTEEAAIAGLVVIILSGLALQAAVPHVTRLLAPFGFPRAAIVGAMAMLWPHLREPRELGGVNAGGWVNRTLPARQAAYLLSAIRRLAEDPEDEPAERRYLRQHLNAERARREAAAKVDKAAEQWGPVLGWRSVRDERVTPECRAADGRNFSATRPPLIGYPGTLHGGTCRCFATAPWPDAEMLV